MTKILSILALSLALHAEDALKVVEICTTDKGAMVAGSIGICQPWDEKQATDTKAENERLTKMLNAYAGKYQRCDQELTVMQTLGVQPTQAGPVKTQRRPLAPSPQPSTSVDEHALPLPPAKSK